MNSKQICPQCGKSHAIFAGEVCLRCHERKLAAENLILIECRFSPKTPYNAHIFNLFLRYIRRCQLRSGYVQQAKMLAEVLERCELTPVLSWQDVYQLSDRYRIYDNNYRKTGSAFKKIGRMLEELGVIGASSDEGRNQKRYDKLMLSLDEGSKPCIADFLNMLRSKNRSLRTTVVYLEQIIQLQRWSIKHDYSSNILLLSREHFDCYFLELKELGRSQNQNYAILQNFKKLFRYLCFKNKIYCDPIEHIDVVKPSTAIKVLSQKSVEIIRNYIKTAPSAENALILILILYWGLELEDLIFAQLKANNRDYFSIVLRRKPLSYGKKRYNRDQEINFENSPPWLIKILIAYYQEWFEHLQCVKKSFQGNFLFLPDPKSAWISKPLDHSVIKKRFRRALAEALGDKRNISMLTLRNTCGVLFTKDDDGSLLTRLGWSEKQSFEYTHREKIIINPPTK